MNAIELNHLIGRVAALSKNRLGMRLHGASVPVARFMPPQAAGEGDMSFLTDPRYAGAMKTSNASVLVLREKDARAIFGEALPERTILLCEDPYAFFAFASQVFFPVERTEGIHPLASVDPEARVAPSASVDAFAVIRRGAEIGPGALISAGAYVGERVTVGEDAVVYPNAVLMPDTVVGARAVIQPGAVLGGDGFGFAPFKGEWVKIPQRGRTVLGDDVEIGANTTIDRGALEDTVVGEGTKLDNQIQLGHNVKIGRHCVAAACVGIAGSTTVEDHCILGGAAMINGHITIPAGSSVGPATSVVGWGKKPEARIGYFPPFELKEFRQVAATVSRLPQMRKDLKALEREVERLKALIQTKDAE